MDYETPSYCAFSYFINEEIKESAQDIFKAVMAYIGRADGVDLQNVDTIISWPASFKGWLGLQILKRKEHFQVLFLKVFFFCYGTFFTAPISFPISFYV